MVELTVQTAMTIKISGEELSHLPDSSIAFKDGSGYIAELAVYHELHCIVRTPMARKRQTIH